MQNERPKQQQKKNRSFPAISLKNGLDRLLNTLFTLEVQKNEIWKFDRTATLSTWTFEEMCLPAILQNFVNGNLTVSSSICD